MTTSKDLEKAWSILAQAMRDREVDFAMNRIEPQSNYDARAIAQALAAERASLPESLEMYLLSSTSNGCVAAKQALSDLREWKAAL